MDDDFGRNSLLNKLTCMLQDPEVGFCAGGLDVDVFPLFSGRRGDRRGEGRGASVHVLSDGDLVTSSRSSLGVDPHW